ncbi:SGNH/GDSL hydrolase family protein [Phytoactinopolyspora endophytica]|uniref:SGNH/GDSL hydrolase family protein n=1 Tax=Phytoactinopolyspora endophytica TaxID=1642495 RepID=UPI00101D4949|nr:SGNH/GDSL hydrolase family protein [Phytoactinopolyspora endophytica]
MNLTISGLVVCGDSLSAGVGDPAPRAAGRPRQLHGWVHHLVENQPGITLDANLARIGATVSHARRRQLPQAIDHAPDVVICAIGANDVLSPGFDPAAFADDYDALIAALTHAATVGVLTFTLHDVAGGLPLTRRRHATVRARTARVNEVIERVSERHSCWLLDTRTEGTPVQLGMLSVDRLHPNPRGHRYLASRVAESLSLNGVCPPGEAAVPPPPDPVLRRARHGYAHATWLARHVVWPRARRRWASRAGGRTKRKRTEVSETD